MDSVYPMSSASVYSRVRRSEISVATQCLAYPFIGYAKPKHLKWKKVESRETNFGVGQHGRWFGCAAQHDTRVTAVSQVWKPYDGRVYPAAYRRSSKELPRRALGGLAE